MGYWDRIGIQDDQLREIVERALEAAQDVLIEGLREAEMIEESYMEDGGSGLAIRYGEGKRYGFDEQGEIDIQIDVSRFQTKQAIAEEEAMYADDEDEEEV